MSRLVAVLAISLACPAAALGQRPANSFANLPLLVRPGDRIQVIDRAGREVRGRIAQLSPAAIRLSADGREEEIREEDVVLIRQQRADSLLNGTLIGAGIGAGAGLLMEAACSGDSYCAEAPNGQAFVGGMVWGAGIGLLVDVLKKTPRDVFRASPGRAALQVGGFAGRGRATALVTLRW